MDRLMRILHLEDSSMDAELIRETITRQGVRCEIKQVSGRDAFEEALRGGEFDLVLCDYGIPGYSGLTALGRVRDGDPDLPFILLSGTLGEEQAVEALKLGANDYILKNRVHRLGPAIHRAVHEFQEKRNRRRADEALRLNEERLSCVLRATNDAVWDWDIARDSMWWNQGLQTLFGHSSLGRKFDSQWWIDLIHPDDRDRVSRTRMEALSSHRQTWGEEYRFICSDGNPAFVFDRGYILRDAEGKAVRMIGSMMDITERKKNEEQIRRQAQLLELTHDAIFVTDLNRRIQYWNAGAERLYGWPAAEAVGQETVNLLYRDHPQTPAVKAVMEQGEWTGELRHSTKSGAEVVVISRRTLMRDPTGHPAGILNINTDITEQKRLEVQFLQAQRLECVGSLAGGIAHDLNNMLSPILMAADMLRDREINPDDRSLLDLIVTSANRGAALIKQILAFSKGVISSQDAFNLRHLVLDIEKVLRATLPREIKLETHFSSNTLPIKADPTQVHQVIMNLCINARDAMPDGGRLSIRCREAIGPDDQTLVGIDVVDTGTGIPPHLLEKIFDPFFTTKDPGKGTGLGLPTVKKIVSAHGGRIEVASRLGQGSTFTIYLPSSKDLAPQIQKPLDRLPRGAGETVLVVDDEAALREILKTTIESFGYRVAAVASGAEALELLGRERFDVLLTDMEMPGISGAELLEWAADRVPETVSVLMTGVIEQKAVRGEAPFAKVLLPKPFSTTSLLEALKQAAALCHSSPGGFN